MAAIVFEIKVSDFRFLWMQNFHSIWSTSMPDGEIPADFESISRLLDDGDLDTARDILARTDETDDTYNVLRLKLSILDHSVSPNVALQKLIQMMRTEPNLPGARALYQEASKLAYAERQSSASHSHIPPPVRPKS
jgi:hypothetical protein